MSHSKTTNTIARMRKAYKPGKWRKGLILYMQRRKYLMQPIAGGAFTQEDMNNLIAAWNKPSYFPASAEFEHNNITAAHSIEFYIP